jgi:translation initiation factor 5A
MGFLTLSTCVGEKWMSRRTEVSSLKIGHHVLIQSVPCRIVEYEKSKPGKHGSAKARIVAIGIFDNVKRSIVSPVNAKVDVPIIEKRNGQIISIPENSVQLMDLETFEVFFTSIPDDEELKQKLAEGLEIEYWKVLDDTMIMRIKR